MFSWAKLAEQLRKAIERIKSVRLSDCFRKYTLSVDDLKKVWHNRCSEFSLSCSCFGIYLSLSVMSPGIQVALVSLLVSYVYATVIHPRRLPFFTFNNFMHTKGFWCSFIYFIMLYIVLTHRRGELYWSLLLNSLVSSEIASDWRKKTLSWELSERSLS